ncbi:unnamed protein product, partial [Cercopithifilaria johnstoni]
DANKDHIRMEINSKQYNYDTAINPEHEILKNLMAPETHFLQNLQTSHFRLSSLLSNPAPDTLIANTPIICSLDKRSSDLNMEIPQYTYCYQQSAMIKDCCSSFKESKTVQTQTSSTSEITTAVQVKPSIQRENLQRHINFDFKSLELKNPTISVRSRLLSNEDEDHNGEQNRHLSDIELLRQVYDELRHKISQA